MNQFDNQPGNRAQGFTGYQPGMPISNVSGATSTPGIERFNAANNMIIGSLFGEIKSQSAPTATVQAPQSMASQMQPQNNQALQSNTQGQYEDPTMRAAANVLVEQEARRIAEESVPSFFRTGNQPQAGNSQQTAQGNNQQFGSSVSQASVNNQTPSTSQTASNDDWWSRALGVTTPNPNNNAAQSNGNVNQQQQFGNGQTTNNASQQPSDDLTRYGQNIHTYNTRMYTEALKAGVDIEQFKQVMASMSPEKAASMVISELRARVPNNNNNNGSPMPNNQMNVQGNGYNPVNPNSLQGYNGQPINNNGVGYIQPNNLPNNNAPNNQVPIQLASLPGSNNVSVTGVKTGHRYSSSWGSEN